MEYIYGIVNFPIPLYCHKEVLGNSFNISLGKHNGFLEIPGLPEWMDNEKDPLNKPLLAPKAAKTWKNDDKLIFWGRPQSYPNGYSLVEKALMSFETDGSLPNHKVGNEISEKFPGWLELFNTYTELIARQNLTIDTTVKNALDQLDLFSFNETGIGNHHYRYNYGATIFLSSVSFKSCN